MGREDAALSCLLGDQEEVIGVVLLSRVSVVYHTTVNNCASRGVLDLFGDVEESLVDSLVHNHHCNLGVGHWNLLFQDCLQSLEFICPDLVSHGITYTISEDNDVFNIGLVIVPVGINSSSIAFLNIFSVSNFLSFLLIIHLGVIFGIGLIQSSTEPYD